MREVRERMLDERKRLKRRVKRAVNDENKLCERRNTKASRELNSIRKERKTNRKESRERELPFGGSSNHKGPFRKRKSCSP